MIALRKNFLLLIICITVLLCGCQRQKVTVSPVTADFCCDCSFEFKQEQYCAFLSVKQDGDFLLEFNRPDSIKGLIFHRDKNGFGLSYNGIKSELSEEMLPQSSYPRVLNAVLEAVNRQSPNITCDIKNAEVLGQCELGQYSVLFRADGFIKKITLESHGLQVLFSNCRYNF